MAKTAMLTSEDSPEALAQAAGAARNPPGIIGRASALLMKATLGVLMVMTPLTAIVVLGWLMRVMEREFIRRLYTAGLGKSASESFNTFASRTPELSHLVRWPNWILAQDPHQYVTKMRVGRPGWRRRISLAAKTLFGSLWINIAKGLASLLLLVAIMLPAVLLWLLGWWGGWENSFNKGYEQAWVGPTVSLLGVAWFVAVMTHVPFAQVRFAVAGQWPSFFRFRKTRSILRHRRFAVLRYTLWFLIAGATMAVIKGSPLALGNLLTQSGDVSESELRTIAFIHQLAAALAVFGLATFLRVGAARIYAEAIVDAVWGNTGTDILESRERHLVDLLGVVRVGQRPARGALRRAVAWTGTRLWSVIAGGCVLLAWVAFAFWIYFAQFLNHDWIDWLYHPLIQLPWASQ